MYYLLYSLFAYFLQNPLLLLLGLVAVYLLIDQRYLGFLPDLRKYFRRRQHLAKLAAEIRLNPANATAQLELGALHLERRHPGRAVPLLEKARERMPDSARLLALLGSGYRQLGRTREAREALTAAVALNPKIGYGEPYYHLLALAYQDEERDPGAIESYREKILSLGSAEIFYRAGRVLLRAGDREGAAQMFREAVDNYQAAPKGFRRVYRRWAAASRIRLMLRG